MNKEKRVHFLAIKSNLGMRDRHINMTPGLEKANVAFGAEKLLEWAKEILPEAQAENVGGDELWQARGIRSDILDLDYINDIYSQVAKEITAKSGSDEIVVILGGDHSVTLPAVVAAQRKIESSEQGFYHPEKFGLLMFDSHTDLHQPETSPTDNFHGMWLRVLSDDFHHTGLDKLAKNKIKPENILLVGDRSFDFERAEAEFIKKAGVKTLDLADYDQNPKKFVAEINNFIRKFENLHLTFDLDFVSSDQVAVNVANPQGFTMENWGKILPELQKPEKISISFVELNPLLPKAEKKIENSKIVFEQFLKHFA